VTTIASDATSIGDLLAPDPLLPHRDDHLATEWVCRRLSALTGRPFEPVRLVRAKYRIGESVRAVHAVTIDGAPATVSGRTFPNGGTKAARQSPDALYDTEHETVWWTFPDDRRLVGVPDVIDADPHLARVLGIDGWTTSTVAEYAPERSLTVRADGAAQQVLAYVKLYAPGTVDVARFAERYRRARPALAALPGVVVPEVLGATDAAIAISPMPGAPWTTLAADRVCPMLTRLGEAIAHFHTIDPAGVAAPFGRMQVPRVVHSAELVARARPDLADALDEIATCLAGGPPAGDPTVLLHGDCHPRNSLIDGDRLALIDLDQAGAGAPACDVASLIARLRHGAVLGETTRDEASAREQAFLAGYTRHRELPSPASLRWHVAAAYMAERAIRAVNRVNVPALASLDRLVALALDEARRLDDRRMR
jgi:aminoglycoside phosphotransferase (APT) family kinase protein